MAFAMLLTQPKASRDAGVKGQVPLMCDPNDVNRCLNGLLH